MMRKFFLDNGLSLVLLVSFLALWGGQSVVGWHQHNQDQQEHGSQAISFGEYLRSGAFLEATAENWESEFLQMFFYVWLTTFLYQRGSAESKKLPDEKQDPEEPTPKHLQPAAARAGGWRRRLYAHSLTVAFAALFLVAFVAHGVGGAQEYNEEQAQHGQPQVSTVQYFATSRFWFESLQNWQSEFLAVFCMVVLSIWLREHGSPESKPVEAPHSRTGA